MAVMAYREPNQVKWIGTRPGHDGEQKIINFYIVNDSLRIYTVPAGKIWLLNAFNVWSSNPGGVVGTTNVQLFTDAAATHCRLCQWSFTDVQVVQSENCYPIPLELYAGYYATINATGVGMLLCGYLHGVLIDA